MSIPNGFIINQAFNYYYMNNNEFEIFFEINKVETTPCFADSYILTSTEILTACLTAVNLPTYFSNLIAEGYDI